MNNQPYPTRLEVVFDTIITFGPFLMLLVILVCVPLLFWQDRVHEQRLKRTEQRLVNLEQYAAWSNTFGIKMSPGQRWDQQNLSFEDEKARELERRIREAK